MQEADILHFVPPVPKEKERTLFISTVVMKTIELILRTIISVDQLSIYRAVADLCEELAKDSSSARKPPANENLGSMVIPTEFLTANTIYFSD